MQKFILSCSALFIFFMAHANAGTTVQILKFDGKDLPPVRDRAHFVTGLRWKDALGENLIVLRETGPYPSQRKNPDLPENRDAELFAIHYLKKSQGYPVLWKLYDFQKDCPVDIAASFYPQSLSLSDLDGDGIAEVSFAYFLQCRGDVSTDRVKVMLYEAKKKYAIRGESQITLADGTKMGGKYTVDPKLKKAPSVFLKHVLSLWKEYSSAPQLSGE